ncbi:MAG: hypothetical protein COU81_01940 [Candidatus Portnoybacteria bacterium CG10_big_fil_rev_8_21_14_0_10_36_7]|uniref:Glycosyltransferase 2-like domain-containing protein n=1 Tax=Candidatus Portnoybacteria bacterium CG10_big_fil_rev_8_21_14_0_10_36_7 TaxID=1974812 RepID=A0A2M8KE97_9BACT|nr:MAG: hypothetical protein COU81_01940 [Candidatus Portnoybacteria bacterium CG10_big_fil_rev_8_21_14_0_10_36_7]
MQNNYPLVSIIIPVKDSNLYIKICVESILSQTYSNIETIIYNNSSSDDTIPIAKKIMPGAKIINSKVNHFVGPAFNRAMKECHGKYIVLVCADVILDSKFIENAVNKCEINTKIGVLQPKILKFDLKNSTVTKSTTIDTTGFLIYKNGRIINRGHGDTDTNQFAEGQMFSYEGASPFFRKKALDDALINGELFDEDFVWMAEDIDLGWRLTNLGWLNYYSPDVISWHDRKTTKRISSNKFDFIRLRKSVPTNKRRLDFQNIILTYVKNLPWASLKKHFISIFLRQAQLMMYIILLEPTSISAFWGIIKKFPSILRKRHSLMQRIKISSDGLERWII